MEIEDIVLHLRTQGAQEMQKTLREIDIGLMSVRRNARTTATAISELARRIDTGFAKMGGAVSNFNAQMGVSQLNMGRSIAHLQHMASALKNVQQSANAARNSLAAANRAANRAPTGGGGAGIVNPPGGLGGGGVGSTASAAVAPVAALGGAFSRTGAQIVVFNQALSLARQGIRAISAAWNSTIEPGREFEQQMTRSLAIMGEVSDSMRDEFRAAAMEMSGEFAQSSTQIAEAFYGLASAGLDAEQSIRALPVVLRFATAGAFELERATTLLVDAQKSIGLASDDAQQNMVNLTRVSDVLTKAEALTTATTEQLAESLAGKGGAAARILGKSLEETTAVLAAYANQGVKGREAAEKLNQVFRDIPTAINKAGEAWKDLEVIDTAGNLKNMADVVDILTKKMRGMGALDLRAFTKSLGLQDRSVIALLQLLGTGGVIREVQSELEQAAGYTAGVAEKQLDNFNDQLQMLKNEFENIKTDAFLKETEQLQELITKTRTFLEDHGPKLNSFFGSIITTGTNAANTFLAFADSLGRVAEKLDALELPEWVGDLAQIAATIALVYSGAGLVASVGTRLGVGAATMARMGMTPAQMLAVGTGAGKVLRAGAAAYGAGQGLDATGYLQEAEMRDMVRSQMNSELEERLSKPSEGYRPASDFMFSQEEFDTRLAAERKRRDDVGRPLDVADLRARLGPNADLFLGASSRRTAPATFDTGPDSGNTARKDMEIAPMSTHGDPGLQREVAAYTKILDVQDSRRKSDADAAKTQDENNKNVREQLALQKLGEEQARESASQLKRDNAEVLALIEKQRTAEEKLLDVKNMIEAARARGFISDEVALEQIKRAEEAYETGTEAYKERVKEIARAKAETEKLIEADLQFAESVRDALDPLRAANREIARMRELRDHDTGELVFDDAEVRDYATTLVQTTDEFSDGLKDAIRGVGDELTDALVDGTENGLDGMLDLLDTFRREILKVATREFLVNPLLNPITDMIQSSARGTKPGLSDATIQPDGTLTPGGSIFDKLFTLGARNTAPRTPREAPASDVFDPSFGLDGPREATPGPWATGLGGDEVVDEFSDAASLTGDAFLDIAKMTGEGFLGVIGELNVATGALLGMVVGGDSGGIGAHILRALAGAAIGAAVGAAGQYAANALAPVAPVLSPVGPYREDYAFESSAAPSYEAAPSSTGGTGLFPMGAPADSSQYSTIAIPNSGRDNPHTTSATSTPGPAQTTYSPNVNVNFAVTAMDSKSFGNGMIENRRVVEGIVMQAIERGGKMSGAVNRGRR